MSQTSSGGFDQHGALASARQAVRRRSVDSGSLGDYLPTSERVKLMEYRQGEENQFYDAAEQEAKALGDDGSESGLSVYDANEISSTSEASEDETANVYKTRGSTKNEENIPKESGYRAETSESRVESSTTWGKSRDGTLKVPPRPPPRPPPLETAEGRSHNQESSNSGAAYAMMQPDLDLNLGGENLEMTKPEQAKRHHPPRPKGARRRSIAEIMTDQSSESASQGANTPEKGKNRSRRRSISLDMISTGIFRVHREPYTISSLVADDTCNQDEFSTKDETKKDEESADQQVQHKIQEDIASVDVVRSLRFMKEQMTTHAQVGVQISTFSMQIVEGGAVDLYTIVLESEPRAPVRVTAACGDGKELLITPSEVLFYPEDWYIPRSVRVAALDDLSSTGDCRGIILHRCSSTDERYGPSLPVSPINVTMIDADSGFLHSFGDRTYGKLGLGGAGTNHGATSLAQEALSATIDLSSTPDMLPKEKKIMSDAVNEAVQHIGNPFTAWTGQTRSVIGVLRSSSLFSPQIVTLLPFPRLLKRVQRIIRKNIHYGNRFDGTSRELARMGPLNETVERERVIRRVIIRRDFVWHTNALIRLAVGSGNFFLVPRLLDEDRQAKFDLYKMLSQQYVVSNSSAGEKEDDGDDCMMNVSQRDGLSGRGFSAIRDHELLEFRRQGWHKSSNLKDPTWKSDVDNRLWKDQWDASFANSCPANAREEAKLRQEIGNEAPSSNETHKDISVHHGSSASQESAQRRPGSFFIKTEDDTRDDYENVENEKREVEQLTSPHLSIYSDYDRFSECMEYQHNLRTHIIEYFGLSRMKFRRKSLYVPPNYECKRIRRREKTTDSIDEATNLSPRVSSGKPFQISTEEATSAASDIDSHWLRSMVDQSKSPTRSAASSPSIDQSKSPSRSTTSPRFFSFWNWDENNDSETLQRVACTPATSDLFEYDETVSTGTQETLETKAGTKSVLAEHFRDKVPTYRIRQYLSADSALKKLPLGDATELRKRLFQMSTSRIRRIISEAERELDGSNQKTLIHNEVRRDEREYGKSKKHKTTETYLTKTFDKSKSPSPTFVDSSIYPQNPEYQDWDLWNISEVDEEEKQRHILRTSADYNLLLTFDPILRRLEDALRDTGDDIDETVISIVIQINLRKQQLHEVAKQRRLMQNPDSLGFCDHAENVDNETETVKSVSIHPKERAFRRARLAGALLYGRNSNKHVDSTRMNASLIDKYSSLGLSPREMLIQSWKDRQTEDNGVSDASKLALVASQVYRGTPPSHKSEVVDADTGKCFLTPYDSQYDPEHHAKSRYSDTVQDIEFNAGDTNQQPVKQSKRQSFVSVIHRGLSASGKVRGSGRVSTKKEVTRGGFSKIAAAVLIARSLSRKFRERKARREQKASMKEESHRSKIREKEVRIFRRYLTEFVERKREEEKRKEEEVEKKQSELVSSLRYETESNNVQTSVQQEEAGDDGSEGATHIDTNSPSSAAKMAESVIRIAHIAVGGNHSLAIVSGGTLFSWGKGLHGQLGRGDNADGRVPSLVRALAQVPIVKISGGENHSAAVSVHGDCFTWGRSDEGQTGHGNILPSSPNDEDDETERMPPECSKYGGLSKFYTNREKRLDKVDPLDYHDNRNYARTYNKSDITVPRLVSVLGSLGRVVDVSCGANHTIFLLVTGAVYGCGSNVAGQLGLGDDANNYVARPTKIPLPESSYHVAAGTFHTACVVGSGDVYTFGLNSSGQLGIGDKKNRTSPTLVASISISRFLSQIMKGTRTLSDLSTSKSCRIRKVSCGGNHTLALTESKRVMAWGCNQHGQLGLGDTKNVYTPQEVWALAQSQSVADIDAGTQHSIFISEQGALYICGNGEFGNLGMSIRQIVKTNKQFCRVFKHHCTPDGAGPEDRSTIAEEGIALPRHVRLEKEMQKHSILTLPVLVQPFVGMHVLSAACGQSHTLVLTASARNASKKAFEGERERHRLTFVPPKTYKRRILNEFLHKSAPMRPATASTSISKRTSLDSAGANDWPISAGHEHNSERKRTGSKKRRRIKKKKKFKRRDRYRSRQSHNNSSESPQASGENQQSILPGFNFNSSTETGTFERQIQTNDVSSSNRLQYQSDYSIAAATEDTDPGPTLLREEVTERDEEEEVNGDIRSRETRPATASRAQKNYRKPVRPPRRPKSAGYNRRQRHMDRVRQIYGNEKD